LPWNRSSLVLISNGPAETFRLGKILGEALKMGDCVALTGELGAGKTCLTQGIASGLGISDSYAVTSPTFTIINEYPGRETALYHVDLYRLSGFADLEEIGYEEYLLGKGVTVIEWAEKIPDAIPSTALCIHISYLDENRRRIAFFGLQDRNELFETIFNIGGF
jgi:tRNA threonylcarbamoyladenosine biosynthesis protein TsaE